MGYHPWGLKESDTTERLTHTHTHTHTHIKEEAGSPWRREGSPKEGHPGGMVKGRAPGEASRLPGQNGGTYAGADAGRWSCLEGGR